MRKREKLEEELNDLFKRINIEFSDKNTTERNSRKISIAICDSLLEEKMLDIDKEHPFLERDLYEALLKESFIINSDFLEDEIRESKKDKKYNPIKMVFEHQINLSLISFFL